MKLSERLRLQDGANDAPPPLTVVPEPQTLAPPKVAASERTHTIDPLTVLKQRIQAALYERLGSRLCENGLVEDELRSMVTNELTAALEAEPIPLTTDERSRLVGEITDDVLGYGPIERYLADP